MGTKVDHHQHRDKIPGGKADKKRPEDFDHKKLMIGLGHEMEHTSDQDMAMEIAMDHLAEDEDYYHKLAQVEKAHSVQWKANKNFRPVRKINFQGLDVSIEHDKGMTREWKDRDGSTGSTKMTYPYGYICRTNGADGEQVDVYVGPNKDSDKVFIVHQMAVPDFTKYDEDKVMVGFESAREAKAAYLMHFNDPKFFGSMTTTDIESFKRMFVNKSIDAEYESLRRSLMSTTDEAFQKGLVDQLKKLWGKVKAKFGGGKQEPAKPTKTWVRNTDQECKTGVCIRLDGQTIAIDDTFTAMKGMPVDGPPAHTSCKCSLEFSMGKSVYYGDDYDPEREESDPEREEVSENPENNPERDQEPKDSKPEPVPAQPDMDPTAQPMIDPMTGMPVMPIDPHDVETYEGVESLLGRLGSVKDPELMEIASKIWGDGYNFEGQSPYQARAEILGFLLDQRDLLGVGPEEIEQPGLQPSPSLPIKEPGGSSDYSGMSPEVEPSAGPEDSYFEEVPASEPSMDSSGPNYSSSTKNTGFEDTKPPNFRGSQNKEVSS
jgi:hypothetical protein